MRPLTFPQAGVDLSLRIGNTEQVAAWIADTSAEQAFIALIAETA